MVTTRSTTLSAGPMGTMMSLAHANGTIGGVAISESGDDDELVSQDGEMAVRWNQQRSWFEAIDLDDN